LNPAVAAVRNAVKDFFGHHPLPERSLFLVAVSGGADSLALAAASVFVARQLKLRVGGLIIDHGLQAESGKVAEAAAEKLRTLGLEPVLVRRVKVGKSGGPEAAARDARYTELRSVAAELEATLVLTGHTRSDQAETVLLSLARGSGAGSLRGMNEFDSGFGRPLLSITREQTSEAAQALGLEPWNDPHNSDESFTRVRVRKNLLPVLEKELGPGIEQALVRTADLVRDDDEALDALAAGMARQILVTEPLVALPVEGIENRPRALRTRIIRIAAKTAGLGSLTLAHSWAIDELVSSWHGQAAISVPGGSVVRRDKQIVFRVMSEG
jgi:tRNA(Ile)-lysidine synthase